MIRKSNQIDALQRLSAVALTMAQSELAQLMAREAGLRRNLADLTVQKARFTQLPRPVPDAATIAGADMRWQQWADQRRAAINVELAQVLALIDQSQRRLGQAFGRDQAAQALVRQAQKDKDLRKLRRSYYES